MALYDRIGKGYAQKRQPDPRWAAIIREALGDARTVLNVGAGAGSYEPDDVQLIALEPSVTMIRQRQQRAAPAVRGVAERLPFRDGQFDAALAVLTTHHWPNAAAGLREMRRVARRQVVVSWDPETFARRFWLVREYLPELATHEHHLAAAPRVAEVLDNVEVRSLPVPHDCSDGFLGAYWRRPEAYLDPAVRASISAFSSLPAPVAASALRRLEADLRSGRWRETHANVLERDALDLGYCVLIGGEAN